MLESLCVHWWMIGDHSVGHCKKCGATRDFEKLRQEEETLKAISRKNKRSYSLGVLHYN